MELKEKLIQVIQDDLLDPKHIIQALAESNSFCPSYEGLKKTNTCNIKCSICWENAIKSYEGGLGNA